MRAQPSVVRAAQDEPIGQTIAKAVADAVGIDPVDLDPPLYDVIDAEALDGLFGDRVTEGRVEFTMADCEVTVRADNLVTVTPPEAPAAAGSVSP